MNPRFSEGTRRVIPRWRDLATTAALGELNAMNVHGRTFPPDSLAEKMASWNQCRSLFVATDIIGTALLTEPSELFPVREVADAILRPDSDASAAARHIAELVLARQTPRHGLTEFANLNAQVPDAAMTRSQLYARVRYARGALRRDVRNVLRWVELAQAWNLAGQVEKAIDAMNLAVKLAPNNRYVLRCATRLLVHANEEDQAWRLLRKAELTPFDPWLLAAEVGVAGLLNQTPQFVKSGLRFAASGDFGFRDLTELASGLGTLESEHGNRKKARKLFKIAMNDPNENVLAQAAWAVRAQIDIDIDTDAFNVPLSFEAKARLFFQRKDWDRALRESQSWFNDQRFSVDAAIFASYIAAVLLARHDEAISILEAAQLANPDSWILKNNLAFSLASTNRIEDAEKSFADVPPDDPEPSNQGVWLATSGLLQFRQGNISDGKRLYDEAIALFEHRELLSLRAAAAVFKAREVLRAKLDDAAQCVEVARQFLARAPGPESDALLAQIERPTEQKDLLLREPLSVH